MQRLWILQINTHHLSLALWLQQIEQGQRQPEGEWPISRYREAIQEGDLLWLWQSGEGPLAQGVCTSTAYRSEDNPDFEWKIGYRITHKFTKKLPRSLFLETAPDLVFFKRPQGDIFKVPPQESQGLQDIVVDFLSPLLTPSALLWPEIALHIQKQGLSLPERSLRQYHLALESQGLVILTGRSGTGKSWLTHAYAKAKQAAYLLVPVSPHWMGPEDLLGYYNAVSERFMPTVVSDFIASAATAWHKAQTEQTTAQAYHLVLDEMNLAPTEQYFAPLLSLLEVRRRKEPAFYQRLGARDLEIPPNLYCIGTVNREHPQSGFSERIADRAFVIALTPPTPPLAYFFTGTAKEMLGSFWPALERCFYVSYRTLEDLQTYLNQAAIYQVPAQEALDEALAQKVFHRPPEDPSMEAILQLQEALPDAFSLSRQALQNHLHHTLFTPGL